MKIIALTSGLAFGFLCTASLVQAQNASKEAGSIEGRVTCTDSNAPARRATVQLVPRASLIVDGQPTGGEALKVVESLTDYDGGFVFSDVPPGDYLIDARSPGYTNDLDLVRLVIDRFTPAQKAKVLSSFPEVSIKSFVDMRKDVSIHRGGAMSGQLTVDTGGTLAQAIVEATLVESPILGNVEPKEMHNMPVFSRQSSVDDRGQFRIAGLPAGKYRLHVRLIEAYFDAIPVTTSTGTEVRMRSQRVGTAALTVYAPSALNLEDAKLLDVRDGDDISGADISIPFRQLHSIMGAVLSAGKPVPGARVTIQREGHPVQPEEALSDRNGDFRFDLLPAASYTLSASGSKISTSASFTGSGSVIVIVRGQDTSDATISIR